MYICRHVFVSTGLQKNPHAVSMTFLSSLNQRCQSILRTCVTNVNKLNLRNACARSKRTYDDHWDALWGIRIVKIIDRATYILRCIQIGVEINKRAHTLSKSLRSSTNKRRETPLWDFNTNEWGWNINYTKSLNLWCRRSTVEDNNVTDTEWSNWK